MCIMITVGEHAQGIGVDLTLKYFEHPTTTLFAHLRTSWQVTRHVQAGAPESTLEGPTGGDSLVWPSFL
jgi:hypothetical protein